MIIMMFNNKVIMIIMTINCHDYQNIAHPHCVCVCVTQHREEPKQYYLLYYVNVELLQLLFVL